jgi:hypothetical protein
MGVQGEPARQQHQRSQQHGRGAFGAQFLQAVGSYRGVGGAVQLRGWGWLGRPLKANGRLFNGHLTRIRCMPIQASRKGRAPRPAPAPAGLRPAGRSNALAPRAAGSCPLPPLAFPLLLPCSPAM